MANDPILSLLGLAKKAGKLETGEDLAGAAAEAHRARLILCAADASPRSRRRAEQWADKGNAPLVTLSRTKAELGGAVGRAGLAMAALTDVGFAAALAEKLAGEDAERWGALAGELRKKKEKRLRRRKEKGRAEKGKKPSGAGGRSRGAGRA